MGLAISHYRFPEDSPEIESLIQLVRPQFESQIVVQEQGFAIFEVQLEGFPESLLTVKKNQRSVELSTNLLAELTLFLALEAACLTLGGIKVNVLSDRPEAEPEIQSSQPYISKPEMKKRARKTMASGVLVTLIGAPIFILYGLAVVLVGLFFLSFALVANLVFYVPKWVARLFMRN